jgi:hypothetical protein
MDIHKNARTTPHSRAAIVARITRLGESIKGATRPARATETPSLCSRARHAVLPRWLHYYNWDYAAVRWRPRAHERCEPCVRGSGARVLREGAC